MDSKMVEKVAKAICIEENGRNGACAGCDSEPYLTGEQCEHFTDHEPVAQAAIAALTPQLGGEVPTVADWYWVQEPDQCHPTPRKIAIDDRFPFPILMHLNKADGYEPKKGTLYSGPIAPPKATPPESKGDK